MPNVSTRATTVDTYHIFDYLPQTNLWEGNVFTPVCVSVRGGGRVCMAWGMSGRGVHGRGMCMGGMCGRGVHGRNMHGRGHAWHEGMCMARGCVAGDMHGWGMHGRTDGHWSGWVCLPRGCLPYIPPWTEWQTRVKTLPCRNWNAFLLNVC